MYQSVRPARGSEATTTPGGASPLPACTATIAMVLCEAVENLQLPKTYTSMIFIIPQKTCRFIIITVHGVNTTLPNSLLIQRESVKKIKKQRKEGSARRAVLASFVGRFRSWSWEVLVLRKSWCPVLGEVLRLKGKKEKKKAKNNNKQKHKAQESMYQK